MKMMFKRDAMIAKAKVMCRKEDMGPSAQEEE